MLAGGPPCQAFSTAGLRRSVHEPRGSVFGNYVEMVRSLRPRFFLFENVRGLLSVAIKHRNYRQRILYERENPGTAYPEEDARIGSVFQKIVVRKFKSLGYEVVYGLLNAADYGTAQVRYRLVVMGSREKEFGAGAFRKQTGRLITPLDLVPPTYHRFSPYAPLRPWRTVGCCP